MEKEPKYRNLDVQASEERDGYKLERLKSLIHFVLLKDGDSDVATLFENIKNYLPEYQLEELEDYKNMLFLKAITSLKDEEDVITIIDGIISATRLSYRGSLS
jgi:hypothetical protein